MNKSKLAFGAIVGAAAGVIAGLLTAPRSGDETRTDLNKKAKELKKAAKRRSDVMYEKLDEAVAKGEHVLKDKFNSKNK